MDMFLEPEIHYIHIYLIPLIITLGIYTYLEKKKNDKSIVDPPLQKVYEVSYWFVSGLIVIQCFYFFVFPAYKMFS